VVGTAARGGACTTASLEPGWCRGETSSTLENALNAGDQEKLKTLVLESLPVSLDDLHARDRYLVRLRSISAGNGLGTRLFSILFTSVQHVDRRCGLILATARGTRLVPAHWFLASIAACFFLIVTPAISDVLIGFFYSIAGPPPALMIGVSSTLVVCAVVLFVAIGCRVIGPGSKREGI
jgi:hypothetical protein